MHPEMYISGHTKSSNNIAYYGYQNTFGGGSYDAFLAKFDAGGTLLWGTYYGGIFMDESFNSSVDPSGNVYLSGLTISANAIAYNGFQNTNGGGFDAFLVKFDAWPTGVFHFTPTLSLSIYPNPIKNILSLDNEYRFTHYHILDIYGKVQIKGNLSSGINQINTSFLSKGICFMEVFGPYGTTSARIIKSEE
jgi:hypothetical protein